MQYTALAAATSDPVKTNLEQFTEIAAIVEHRGARVKNIQRLAGGVSGNVFLIETDNGEYVVKQSLRQLRVEQEWIADRERIFREARALAACSELLPESSVPQLIWVDHDHFAIAMSVLQGSNWKLDLLHGQVMPDVAAAVGDLLGRFTSGSWSSAALQKDFGDNTVFRQLRTEPYYHRILEVNPDLREGIERAIWYSNNIAAALVHGDFSPKNILVSGTRAGVLDFEAVHYGDAAYDAAFCMNHLSLKYFLLPNSREQLAASIQSFWAAMRAHLPASARNDYEERLNVHLAALMLARVDGKSPAEYLHGELHQKVRTFARGLVQQPPQSVSDFLSLLRSEAV